MSIISAVTTLYSIGLSATAVAVDYRYDYDSTYECVTLPDGTTHCDYYSTEELDPDYDARVSMDIIIL